MELDDVFGSEVEQEYTMSDLKRLPYLECCIKESLRLFPPFPIIGRELDGDLEVDGHKIPAGTTCMVNLYSLHRNKAHYADPEEYIPERFLSDNARKMHPFCFIPFSTGVRVCIGQKFVMSEMKVVLAKLLSEYTVEATAPLKDLELAHELVLKPRGGLRVRFRSRTQAE
ncbi:cytochrome P450 4c3-like [Haemaphysalis longicornis]